MPKAAMATGVVDGRQVLIGRELTFCLSKDLRKGACPLRSSKLWKPKPSTRTTRMDRASGIPKASWSARGRGCTGVGRSYPKALAQAGRMADKCRAWS